MYLIVFLSFLADVYWNIGYFCRVFVSSSVCWCTAWWSLFRCSLFWLSHQAELGVGRQMLAVHCLCWCGHSTSLLPLWSQLPGTLDRILYFPLFWIRSVSEWHLLFFTVCCPPVSNFLTVFELRLLLKPPPLPLRTEVGDLMVQWEGCNSLLNSLPSSSLAFS